MDTILQFFFRGKMRSCFAYIDTSKEPCFIFTIQKDNDIIKEYSDEVSVKTDFHKVLPKSDDSLDGIVELRKAIFTAFLSTPEYHQIKAKLKHNDVS